MKKCQLQTSQLSKNKQFKQTDNYVTETEYSHRQRFSVPVRFIAARVHMTYAQAMASADAEKWKTAINEEIQALERNST